MKKWYEDIRDKTKEMDKKSKLEYVTNYYWYHILIMFIMAALILLFIYHCFAGKKERIFTCVIVNQEIDHVRDKNIRDQFAYTLKQDKESICIDSDYLISYDNVQLEGVNESSYEKFFFNWSLGQIDAVIMPESFYQYCLKLGGKFWSIDALLSEESIERWSPYLYRNKKEYKGIFVDETQLKEYMGVNEKDNLILVFPKEGKRFKMCKEFIKFIQP